MDGSLREESLVVLFLLRGEDPRDTFIEKLTKFCSVALMSLIVNYSH